MAGTGAPTPSRVSCPQCGAQVERGRHALCPECGFPFNWAEPPPPEEQPAGMGHRPDEELDTTQPGAGPLPPPPPPPPPVVTEPAEQVPTVDCPACQTPNARTRTLCQRCGARLAAPPPPRPPSQPPRQAPSLPRWLLPAAAAVLLVAALYGAVVLIRDWRSGDDPPAAAPTTASPAPPQAGRVDPGTIDATASSTLADDPGQGLTYGIRNTLDGKRATAWNHNGGRGRGVGETLTYQFPGPVQLDRIELVNGYAKSAEVFRNNGRIRQVLIVTDSARVSATLRDTPQRQRVAGRFGATSKVTIQVRSVYNGRRYPDLALTDIVFFTAA